MAELVKEKVKMINNLRSKVDADLAEANVHYVNLMLLVPNVISPDTLSDPRI